MIAAATGRSQSMQSRDFDQAISNPPRRSIRQLLLPLLKMASASDVLVADSLGCWRSNGELFFLPRFIFQRTLVAKPRVEVGIFAALNGTDFGAIRGVTELLWALNAHPAIGREFRLWLYPLCDPVGYVDHQRAADLDGEMLNDLTRPEAQLIGKELAEREFDGVIVLRSNSLATEVEAVGSTANFDFVTPGLVAAEQVLRNNRRGNTPGFSVRNPGLGKNLHLLPGTSRERFEIVLEVPGSLPLELQGQLFLVSLHAILAAYRRLSSETTNKLLNR